MFLSFYLFFYLCCFVANICYPLQAFVSSLVAKARASLDGLLHFIEIWLLFSGLCWNFLHNKAFYFVGFVILES
jgi:hypothetical protein